MKIRLEANYRHGTRVRIGGPAGARHLGAKGVLWECTRRDGGGQYWRVRLQEVPERWVYPDDSMVVDGAGTVVGTCGRCELPFLHRGAELICARCDLEQFGPRSRDPADVPYRMSDRGPYRRRSPR